MEEGKTSVDFRNLTAAYGGTHLVAYGSCTHLVHVFRFPARLRFYCFFCLPPRNFFLFFLSVDAVLAIALTWLYYAT